MHVSDAVKKIKNYWRSCTSEKMKKSAQEDHYRALTELKDKGYTWGLEHRLPDGIQSLSRRDYGVILNILFSGSKKYDTNRSSAIE